MRNCFIFDLDGTVLDTLNDLAAGVNFALCKNGLPKRSLAEVKSFVGNGIRNLILKSVGQTEENELFLSVFCDFKQYYAVHCADLTHPYHGITELLCELKQLGYKTAVVSNKSNDGVQALVQKYFNGLFHFCVGEKEGVARKPSPDSVFAAMKALNATAEECVYIGDSEVDLQTAANAGIPCVSVLWGFREKDALIDHGATLFAENTNELKNLLLSLN